MSMVRFSGRVTRLQQVELLEIQRGMFCLPLLQIWEAAQLLEQNSGVLLRV
ncbi:hypothetical protein LINPERHAP1_LOCUS24887 [Linum perenne]